MEADELDQAFAQGLSTHEPVISAGNPRSLDKAELIASLPPKQTTDQFVNKFFDPNDPAPPLRKRHDFPCFSLLLKFHYPKETSTNKNLFSRDTRTDIPQTSMTPQFLVKYNRAYVC